MIVEQDLQTETAEPISRALSLKRHAEFVHRLSPANSVIIWYHRNVWWKTAKSLLPTVKEYLKIRYLRSLIVCSEPVAGD